MSRLVLILALLLLIAAPAGAKELGRVSVCGAEGCRDVTDRATHAVLEGGLPADATARPSEEHFRVRIGVGDGRRVVETFEIRWFPRRRLLLADDGVWMHASASTQGELERLTAGMAPLGIGARPVERAERDEEQDGEQEEGDGGAGTAIAIAAPAAAALGAAALLARRRRRRR